MKFFVVSMSVIKYNELVIVLLGIGKQIIIIGFLVLIFQIVTFSALYAHEGDPHDEVEEQCDCYYHEDCPRDRPCRVGWGLCSSNISEEHTGNFIEEGDDKSGNFDGICKTSTIIPIPTEIAQLKPAVIKYIEAIRKAMAFIELPKPSPFPPGTPDLESIAAARAIDLSEENHVAIRTLVRDVTALTLGPAHDLPNIPHTRGYYHNPIYIAKQDDSDLYIVQTELGFVERPDRATLEAYELITDAVIAEISDPGKGIFRQKMENIRQEVPDYNTFGRCEYPHPPEHGHSFRFKDGVDCLYLEIMRILNDFNGLITEKTTKLTSMSTDGSIRVEISSFDPIPGNTLPLKVKFIGEDRETVVEHINYDIVVTQGEEQVLSSSGVHEHEGQSSHLTTILHTGDPVDVKITLQGVGLEEPFSGPIGEVVKFIVVPEFGTISLLILTLAIFSIVFLTYKSKLKINLN